MLGACRRTCTTSWGSPCSSRAWAGGRTSPSSRTRGRSLPGCRPSTPPLSSLAASWWELFMADARFHILLRAAAVHIGMRQSQQGVGRWTL